MPPERIVVLGGSAGGLEPLCKIIEHLPRDFKAAVFVVFHIGEVSVLDQVLRQCGKIRIDHAVDGEPIEAGRIYIAPPSKHLLISDSHVQLSGGPRENRCRPAVDVLFRSAARVYRDRVIGIVLSGYLDDGAAGLFMVKARGGIAIVQSDAAVPEMPSNAALYTAIDHHIPATEIGPLLVSLLKEKPKKPPMNRPKTQRREKPPPNAKPIALSCPECSGPMFEEKSGGPRQYICRIGHRFSPESLGEAHRDVLERSLWIALRVLQEKGTLHALVSQTGKGRRDLKSLRHLEESAESAKRDSKLIREILERL